MTELELLKKSVRADDFDDDDELLQHYLDAAESYVVSLTNRTEDDLKTDDAWPEDLLQAILMLAGHWYNQREAASGTVMSEVPYGVTAICKRYRKLVDSDS